MIIRPETDGDHAVIHDVTAAAFAGQPYSDQTEPLIIDRLRAAGALTLSLVAVEGEEVIGHIAFSPVTIAPDAAGWYGLGPVAVRPDRQGLGIGSALVREGLEKLRELGAAGCVLAGNPAFYQRFGFRNDPALVFPGCAPQYFMVLALSEARVSGTVAYHPAFFGPV
ncbi:GCN5 family N-acetyltransferase [Sinorhizobium fredii USDA 205]|uniref:GNAT family N-acetyltransferase n=1 Tax=Rhizobium fredii TaxID=380 RepID=A0A844AP56_RHIFR|nr:N-acetyltransferase [Sinorhizobium fredii]AWM24916.1 GCN5-related N-acetyltransferase [Sinorhizobium fredii CCBAU 25509]KSV89544.1 GCN5 family N-acetyltransferase [Sinorhizobium fredii USDA 205]MQW95405.1 GNAT family N-acetyltransferase [Sinorhizobium fredii]MQW98376.1 GNAT family N-acetyltransferase [Sinorhizobium fredii]MQX12250.1 GNAT family N-acetyltransferase [Sinorhizobium fredii]